MKDLSTFPPSFRFGAADSDLQVVGEDLARAAEGSCQSMWDHFAENSGKCYQNHTPGRGIERYRRWREDIDLIAGLGIRHYRTSISMSRLMREDGSLNESARDWYARWFSALRERGIAVYATLYHWELPYYLYQRGGWKNRNTTAAFVRHAELAVGEFKDVVSEFFILNEPWCSAHNSFYTGIHAPGEKSLRDALVAAHHLLLAQGLAFRSIEEKFPDAKVGTVVNVEPAYPATDSDADREAAVLADQYFNGWFLDPLFGLGYPSEIQTLYGDSMPEFSEDDMETIAVGSRLHALGINYYLGKIVARGLASPIGYQELRLPNETTNGLGWSVFVPPLYPPGLFDILRQVHARYGPHGLDRIYITENGYAEYNRIPSGSGTIPDQRRVDFLEAHLRQALDAVDSGVPLEAYFLWTLMDNYEWAEGFCPDSNFGIIHVDRETMARRPKQSALWYAELIRDFHARSEPPPVAAPAAV